METQITQFSTLINQHKVSSAIIITAALTITISFSISISAISKIKSDYELKTTKAIIETINRNTTINKTKTIEIVKKLGLDEKTQNNIINSINISKHKTDLTTVNYTFTNSDKEKLTQYIISYLNYYQQLQEDNDTRLSRIYDDKSYDFTKNYQTNDTESLIKYFEKKREEYKKEISRMQELLFDFYGITTE
jgi:hypothetical protein